MSNEWPKKTSSELMKSFGEIYFCFKKYYTQIVKMAVPLCFCLCKIYLNYSFFNFKLLVNTIQEIIRLYNK